MSDTYVIKSASSLARLIQWLRTLDFSKQWLISVKRLEPGSSLEQQAVLRGMEQRIVEITGHDMEEVHDEMLVRHYGLEVVDLGNGLTWERPARRTRTGKNPLGYSEMQEHLRFVENFLNTFLTEAQ